MQHLASMFPEDELCFSAILFATTTEATGACRCDHHDLTTPMHPHDNACRSYHHDCSIQCIRVFAILCMRHREALIFSASSFHEMNAVARALRCTRSRMPRTHTARCVQCTHVHKELVRSCACVRLLILR
jgi:hypothetical protein